jgi:hypothetical protein
MQLDLFQHSSDVMLRNEFAQAMQSRDFRAACSAREALATEYPGNRALGQSLRHFDAQFEGLGDRSDAAWFPAWLLGIYHACMKSR